MVRIWPRTRNTSNKWLHFFVVGVGMGCTEALRRDREKILLREITFSLYRRKCRYFRNLVISQNISLFLEHISLFSAGDMFRKITTFFFWCKYFHANIILCNFYASVLMYQRIDECTGAPSRTRSSTYPVRHAREQIICTYDWAFKVFTCTRRNVRAHISGEWNWERNVTSDNQTNRSSNCGFLLFMPYTPNKTDRPTKCICLATEGLSRSNGTGYGSPWWTESLRQHRPFAMFGKAVAMHRDWDAYRTE